MAIKSELHDAIMQAWQTENDIDALFVAHSDTDISRDSVASVLLGLKELHSLRMNRLYKVFEEATKAL